MYISIAHTAGKCCFRVVQRPENDSEMLVQYKLNVLNALLFLLFSSLTHICFCFAFSLQVLSHLLCTNPPSLLHYRCHFVPHLPSPLAYPYTCMHARTHTRVCGCRCVRALTCEMQNSCGETDRQMWPFPGE